MSINVQRVLPAAPRPSEQVQQAGLHGSLPGGVPGCAIPRLGQPARILVQLLLGLKRWRRPAGAPPA